MGLHTSPDKIEAILQVPKPENISQPRAFIWLVAYYSKFVENVTTVCTIVRIIKQICKLALGDKQQDFF